MTTQLISNFRADLKLLTLMGSKPASDKGFAIAGVPCIADTFVKGGSSVLRTKYIAKTPHHRKPKKRYRIPFDNNATLL